MKHNKKTGFFYAIDLAFQLGFLIAIPLVVFLAIGVYLDKKFSSSPVFTLIFVILSLLFIIAEIRYYLLPFLRRK